MIMSTCKEEYRNIIAVTNRKLSSRPFLEQMERVSRLQPKAVILREKDLQEEMYEELAVKVIELCKQYQVPCCLLYTSISHSQLHLDGDIFYYTAKYDMEKYENSNDPTEELAREVLSAFDSQIDYMDYDSNDDKYVDVFVLSVAGEDTCWQETNGIWKENSGFQLDGMKFGRYIVNDAQPYTENEDGFVEKMNYEFDLCMGLTDYYKR